MCFILSVHYSKCNVQILVTEMVYICLKVTTYESTAHFEILIQSHYNR